QWPDHARELILLKRKEKITLILTQVAAALHQNSARSFIEFCSREMAGRDFLRAELAGLPDEIAELQMLVAHHAGVGCATGLVLGREVIDNHLLKFGRLVDKVIGNAKFVADRAGVHDRLRTAAF